MSENEENREGQHNDHSHYDEQLRRNIVEAIEIVKDLIEECEVRLSGPQPKPRRRRGIRVEIEGNVESENSDITTNTSISSTETEIVMQRESVSVKNDSETESTNQQKLPLQSRLDLQKEEQRRVESIAEKIGLCDSKTQHEHLPKENLELNAIPDCKDFVPSKTQTPDVECVVAPTSYDINSSKIGCGINATSNQEISNKTAKLDITTSNESTNNTASDVDSSSSKKKVDTLLERQK
ncbi:uncharacterized protein LOC119689833 isoform X2 [Teleopsis dalmanni]|uniref:uncharacterized protein LOC119689833 isoform X2 n=1 Tax=Teleopsis dalmanni TaxID=139649 RepID=UPI0018CD62C3|nr:uncharacterized protein LOC119689833 isoform X2 [Teleopsis dalmanni]